MARFLLLGGSGFLGGHIAERLRHLPQGELVTAGRTRPDGGDRHRFVDLTATTVAELSDLLRDEKPDVVVNAAGRTGGDPAELIATNIGGTLTLIGAMLGARPGARLVHIGSAAEYGPAPAGVAVAEDAPARPTSLYGRTKLTATHIVATARAAGLDAVVLRVFNPIGPGAPRTTLPGRVAAELNRARRAGDELRLGPLTAHRDFVDVRDVAEAVIAAASASALPVPVLNVGSGRATPILAVVEELIGIAGFTGGVRQEAPAPARSVEVLWQQADLQTIGRCLGWTPRIDLATSLRDLWRGCAEPRILAS